MQQQTTVFEPPAIVDPHAGHNHGEAHEGVTVDMFGFKLEVFSWEGVQMFGVMVAIALIGALIYKKATGQWIPFQKKIAYVASKVSRQPWKDSK